MAVDAIKVGEVPQQDEPTRSDPDQTLPAAADDDLGQGSDAALSDTSGGRITIYDAKNQPHAVSKDYAEQAILSGSHGLDSAYQYNMASPDGKEYNVPATGVKRALQAGWKLNKTFDAETNQRIKQRIGEGGSLGAGLASAADQAASAVSLGAYDVLKEKAFDPETRETEKAIEEGTAANFPGASTAGRVLGEGIGLAAGLPAFGAAEGIGQLAGRGVLSAAERGAIEGLTKEAIEKSATAALKGSLKGQIVNYTTQGAILASPQAVTEAALGDPKAAGESLLWGTGIGAVLGSVAFGANKAAGGIGTLVEQAGPKANELADKMALKAVGIQKGGARKLGEEGIARNAQVLFDEGIIKPGQSFQDIKAAISDLEEKSGSKIGEYLSRFDQVVDDNPELKQYRFNPFNAAMEIEKQLSKGLETPMYAAERSELNKIVDSVAHFTEGMVEEPGRPESAYQAWQDEIQANDEKHKQTLKDFAQQHIDYYKELGSEVSSEANVDASDRETGISPAKRRQMAAEKEAKEAADRRTTEVPGEERKTVIPGEERAEPAEAAKDLGPEPSNVVPPKPEVPKPEAVRIYEENKAKFDQDVINRPISFQKAQEIKQLFSKFPLSKLDPSPKELLQQRARGIVNGMIQDAASNVINKATELGKQVDPQMFADYMKQKNIYRATQDLIKYGIENRDAANFGNRGFSLTDFISHGKGPVAIGGAAIGAVVGGVGGAVVGHQLGSAADFLLKHWAENKGLSTGAYLLKKAAKDPANLPFIGPLIAHNAVKATNAHLDMVGSLLGTTAKRAVQYGANENIKRLVGNSGSGLSKQQQFAKVSSQISEMAADPGMLADSNPVVSVLGSYAPNVAREYVQASANAIRYLDSQLPKNPNPIEKPFEVNDWLPSKQQIHDFDQKLGIVINPGSIIEHINNGTASKAQIDTLTAIYPTYANNLKARMVQAGLSDPSVPEKTKQKISLLLGVPVGKRMNNLSLYQASYAPAGQQPKPNGKAARGAAKIKDLPSLSPDHHQRQ
jgi:hypothetical protein